jgi:hypothetical protein
MNRRLLVRIFFLVASLMVIAAFIATSSRRTVSAETKSTNGIRYGYQLESYRFRDRMFLRFWNSAGLSLEFDLPGYAMGQLQETRWLAGDGAVYLHGMMAHRDGAGEATVPVKILFDFRSGELFVSSPAPLWRLPSSSDWLTDAEFDAILAKIAETRTK